MSSILADVEYPALGLGDAGGWGGLEVELEDLLVGGDDAEVVAFYRGHGFLPAGREPPAADDADAIHHAAPGEGEGSAILAGLRSDRMAKVVGHSANILSMLALDAPVGHFADRRSRRVRDAGSTAEHGEPLLKIGDQIAGGFEADIEADDPAAVGVVADTAGE